MVPLDPASTYPAKSKNVVWKVLGGETVVLSLDSGVYFTLNNSGTAVWEQIDGAASLAEIGHNLCTQFDVTFEQVQGDLIEMTQALLNEGLIRVTDDASTTPGVQRA